MVLLVITGKIAKFIIVFQGPVQMSNYSTTILPNYFGKPADFLYRQHFVGCLFTETTSFDTQDFQSSGMLAEDE